MKTSLSSMKPGMPQEKNEISEKSKPAPTNFDNIVFSHQSENHDKKLSEK